MIAEFLAHPHFEAWVGAATPEVREQRDHLRQFAYRHINLAYEEAHHIQLKALGFGAAPVGATGVRTYASALLSGGVDHKSSAPADASDHVYPLQTPLEVFAEHMQQTRQQQRQRV